MARVCQPHAICPPKSLIHFLKPYLFSFSLILGNNFRISSYLMSFKVGRYVYLLHFCLHCQKWNSQESTCPKLFCKKSVLKHLLKFTGKHLCQSLEFSISILETYFENSYKWFLLKAHAQKRADYAWFL